MLPTVCVVMNQRYPLYFYILVSFIYLFLKIKQGSKNNDIKNIHFNFVTTFYYIYFLRNCFNKAYNILWYAVYTHGHTHIYIHYTIYTSLFWLTVVLIRICIEQKCDLNDFIYNVWLLKFYILFVTLIFCK